MSATLGLDRSLISGTGSTGPVPAGTERVEQLIEWIGIAIIVALVVSAVILMRNRRKAAERP